MRRVLVVEDDAAVRVLVERLLCGAGYSVQTAPDARQAAAYILYDLPQTPDIALLDIVLPGINGLEYADDLRHRFPSIRIVFMTGWQENLRQQDDARHRGVLLLKPFDRQSLLSALANGS